MRFLARRKKYTLANSPGPGKGLLIAFLLLGSAGLLVWLSVSGKLEGVHWPSFSKSKTNAVASKPLKTNVPIAKLVNTNDLDFKPPPPKIEVKTNVAQTIARTNTESSKKPTNAPAADETAETAGRVRPVRNTLEAQIALARRGISCGCIDGSFGSQTRRALVAFQIAEKLSISGDLDAETKSRLEIEEPVFLNYSVTSADMNRLQPLSPTWLGKSEQSALDYETVLELVAEKGRASIALVKSLNPGMNWKEASAGTIIKIPRVDPPPVREKAAFIRIFLSGKQLEVFGRSTNLLAHYPCSIAQKVEKRPTGVLHVAKVAIGPNYLFDPAVFPESEEAQKIGRKLLLPPGPNNPVGTAWIGLDKPGYGIHGTPKPEQVGRTESHGCFRLANWNAEHLVQLVWVGMPVMIDP